MRFNKQVHLSRPQAGEWDIKMKDGKIPRGDDMLLYVESYSFKSH